MDRLKDLREGTGLSQAKFSERLGVPLRTYQSWEEGKRKPAPYIISMIEIIVQYWA